MDALVVVALVAGAIGVTIRHPRQITRHAAFPAALGVVYGVWRWRRERR